MKAGVDFGSSLIKAYWRKKDGTEVYRLRSYGNADDLQSQLVDDGVTQMRVTGTGAATAEAHFPGLKIIRGGDDAIADEIELQAAGVIFLYGSARPRPRKLIIASIGTGTSYTKVVGTKAKKSPLGNANGGGTVLAFGRKFGHPDFDTIESLASKAASPHMRVKDKLAETSGTPMGELILSYFGNLGPETSPAEMYAGIISQLAADVSKDIAILGSIPFAPKDVVFIGTIVGRSPTLRAQLSAWAPMHKRNLHFLQDGAHAAAIGAYLALAR